jgi:PKD repeat protein
VKQKNNTMKTKLLFTSLALSVIAMTGIKAQACLASGTVTTTPTPGLVNINDMSTTTSGAANTVSYISFTGGGYVNLQPATTSGTYQFTSNGTYDYYLEVIDSLTNCYDSIGGSITITGFSNSPCDADFNYSDSVMSVSFDALSNSGSALNYSWDFGDGNSSSMEDPTHTYSSPGTYTVCLIVWSPTCSDTVCQSITASQTGVSCNAAYVLLQDSVNAGLYYAWNNSTGTNLTYSWDFGDGNSSTLPYPSHTYAATGTYVICLTVTSPSCTSTYCDTLVATVKSNGTTLNVLQPGQVVGIEKSEFVANLNTYPNPFGSFVNISISSSYFQELEVSVIAIDGSQVFSKSVSIEAGDNIIELNDLVMSSGIYLLHVINPATGQSKMHKMIKK